MTETTTTTDLARIAARAADAKKGDDIVILDVGDIMGIVDSFVITSASNTRLVRTLVDDGWGPPQHVRLLLALDDAVSDARVRRTLDERSDGQ